MARRYVLLWLWTTCIWCALTGAGCAGVGYEFGQRCRRELLRGMTDTETLACKNIVAYYPAGMDKIARYSAQQFAGQLAYVHDVTGWTTVFATLHIYVKPVDRMALFDDFGFLESRDTFGVVLHVERSNMSYEAVVAGNLFYPSSVMHEIVEWSLPQLLNDYRWKTSGGGWKEEFHFTRWFRDGFAEYAGFLAYKMTVFDNSFARHKYPIGKYQQDVGRHPFSALARVGKELFAWDQYHEDPTPREHNPNVPHVGDTNYDYYQAGLGLFLVIEDRYGTEAIKEIVQRVQRLKKGDGAAVKEICGRVLRTDIVKLVDEFHFPHTGLYMSAYWPDHYATTLPASHPEEGLAVELVGSDSPASRAGIGTGDVVMSVDGERTVTNLDFEQALYRRMHQKSVVLGVWRHGVGRTSVQLCLEQ